MRTRRPRFPAVRAAWRLADASSRARTALLWCALAHVSIFAGAGCSHPEAADAPAPTTSKVDVAPQLAEIEKAFEPVSLSATTDLKDASLARQRDAVEKFRKGPVELGRAAWKRLNELGADRDDLRVALLDIAVHAAPKEIAPRLVAMIQTYDAKLGLRLRSNAVRFVADAAPREAQECLEPLAKTPHHSATMPEQDLIVDGWIRAARATNSLDAEIVANIATNIEQEPHARARAIEELGRIKDSQVGRKALELVLVESGSDGYLRRKAAQAVEDSLPQKDACEIFLRVADREVDQQFLLFLKDMLERHCP